MRNNVLLGLQLQGSQEGCCSQEPVYLRLDLFEEKKLVDLTRILKTLYSTNKKEGRGVTQRQLIERSMGLREKLREYGLTSRNISFMPRLHRTEKESLADLPRFYPKGYKEKREKEHQLHLAVDQQVSQTFKKSAKCMEDFLRQGGTDVVKVKRIQRKYKADLKLIRKEINLLCHRNK